MAGNTTQVRDISDSRTDGLQLALDRAAQAGFYPAFMWPWGNFTRIVFRRHPDTHEKVVLPNAKRLSRRYRGDVAEARTAEAQRLAENAAWRSKSRRKAKCARCDRLNKTAGSKYCPTCKALIEEDGYAS